MADPNRIELAKPGEKTILIQRQEVENFAVQCLYCRHWSIMFVSDTSAILSDGTKVLDHNIGQRGEFICNACAIAQSNPGDTVDAV